MKFISCRPVALGLLSLALLSSPPSVRAGEQAATWSVTPYLWAATFDGTIGLPGDGGDPGDGPGYDFGDLWSNLRLGGAMVNVAWRSGRWSAFGDWTYAKVSSDLATPLDVLWSGAKGEVRGHIVQAAGGYQLIVHREASLDAFLGVRFYDLDTFLTLKEGLLPGSRLNGMDRWVDGVAGLRGELALGEKWTGSALLDVGIGGSRPSWQAVAVVGYRLGWGEVVGGWRHLDVEHDEDRYLLDAALTGPFLGVRFVFQ